MFETFEPRRRPNRAETGHPLSSLLEAILVRDEEDVGATAARLSTLLPLIPKGHRDGVVIVLYQPGKRRLLVSRLNNAFVQNVVEAARAIRRHARFGQFDIGGAARIQVDFFGLDEKTIGFADLTVETLDRSRFEFGVDGLRIRVGGKSHYLLPGDSYVRSIYDLGQLARYLDRLTGGADLNTCTIQRIRSTSTVSYEGRWLRLYRGHPIYTAVSVADVEGACDRAVDHILAQRRSDGRFLYYYDASSDTERNHEHPKRDPARNPYYNELRHAGGIITLLLACAWRDPQLLKPVIEDAIGFLLENSVSYQTQDGRPARYIYYNRKSKLGGSGLTLYVLAFYRKVFGDDRYDAETAGILEHILAQITGSGEFIYYNIYLDQEISEEENGRYFSFYYPGEALVGLATALKWTPVEKGRRAAIVRKIKQALRFLLVDRPALRAEHYTTLPSDAWLMSAILELWEMKEFRDPSYSEFVFGDADKMLSLMYDEKTALYPDYAGAFHYKHGDLPYADGARCEGLTAALGLARAMGDTDRVRRYAGALVKTVRATLLLANTPESLYFAPNPEKALGGIRFKLTRQWFRIDTIQHVVCYYLRFLDHYGALEAEGMELDDRLAGKGEPAPTRARKRA